MDSNEQELKRCMPKSENTNRLSIDMERSQRTIMIAIEILKLTSLFGSDWSGLDDITLTLRC